MKKPCHLCQKEIFEHGSFYCQACASAVRRAVRSKLNPRWKYSKYIRALLLEFTDECLKLEALKTLDTLDQEDQRRLKWVERLLRQLEEVCGGKNSAKHLIVNYEEVYKSYFNASDLSAT